MILFRVVIPGRAGILKNGKRLIRSGNRIVSLPSKKYMEWKEVAMLHIRQAHVKNNFARINFPVNMKALFYFKDHEHECDLSNLLQGPEDLLEECGVIENDKLIYGYDGSRKVFGQEPRIEIELTAIGETK